MSKNTLETVMGTFVLILAGFILSVAYSNSSFKQTNGVHLTASFERIDGVSVGTDVRVSGIKVGTVTNMSIDTENYLAKVTMAVDQKVPLTTDTVAEIASEGLLGGRYIALVPGGSDDMLKDGDTIEHTQAAVSLESLIGQLIFSKEDKDEKKDKK